MLFLCVVLMGVVDPDQTIGGLCDGARLELMPRLAVLQYFSRDCLEYC